MSFHTFSFFFNLWKPLYLLGFCFYLFSCVFKKGAICFTYVSPLKSKIMVSIKLKLKPKTNLDGEHSIILQVLKDRQKKIIATGLLVKNERLLSVNKTTEKSVTSGTQLSVIINT